MSEFVLIIGAIVVLWLGISVLVGKLAQQPFCPTCGGHVKPLTPGWLPGEWIGRCERCDQIWTGYWTKQESS